MRQDYGDPPRPPRSSPIKARSTEAETASPTPNHTISDDFRQGCNDPAVLATVDLIIDTPEVFLRGLAARGLNDASGRDVLAGALERLAKCGSPSKPIKPIVAAWRHVSCARFDFDRRERRHTDGRLRLDDVPEPPDDRVATPAEFAELRERVEIVLARARRLLINSMKLDVLSMLFGSIMDIPCMTESAIIAKYGVDRTRVAHVKAEVLALVAQLSAELDQEAA